MARGYRRRRLFRRPAWIWDGIASGELAGLWTALERLGLFAAILFFLALA
jgi:hypothetical protein